MNDLIQTEDIEVVWLDDGSHGVFSEIGCEELDFSHKAKDLKLDVLFTFKKTTLNSLVDYLFSYGENKINNHFLKEVTGLVKCIILYSLAPNSTEVYFSDSNEFRGMDKLINKEFGEYFFTKESLDQFPGTEILMERMVAKKMLEKDGNRYYIVGHILKNIEINKSDRV